MKKIERLTPEQEAELPRFRAEYLEVACGGGRADRAALQSAFTDAYAEVGKPSPRLFIFDSPAACMLAIKIFEMGEFEKFKSGDQLRGQLRDQLWDQLRGQLRDQLWRQLWHQLWDQLGDRLWGQLWDWLRDQLGGQEIWNPNFLWGSQDLYWIAWAKFAEKIGVKLTEEQSRRLSIMDRIGRQCEWWWPFENVVIASRRPMVVKWDDERRLHCENGPAVEYADGYSLFAWHGTRLPAKWVLERETINPAEILKERDVDVRTAGLACIGLKKLKVTHGTLIHDSGDPVTGSLWELRLPDLPEPGLYLSAMCPRNGEIFEGVMPVSNIDGLPIRTAEAAQAWRRRLPACDFEPSPYRT